MVFQKNENESRIFNEKCIITKMRCLRVACLLEIFYIKIWLHTTYLSPIAFFRILLFGILILLFECLHDHLFFIFLFGLEDRLLSHPQLKLFLNINHKSWISIKEVVEVGGLESTGLGKEVGI